MAPQLAAGGLASSRCPCRVATLGMAMEGMGLAMVMGRCLRQTSASHLLAARCFLQSFLG